jgi:hypothetical protein
MAQTALATVQNVALEINLPRPSAMTKGGQDLAGRAFQILETTCRRLAKKDWPVLIKEHEFYLVQNQSTYDLPSDFDRIIPNTSWDRVESRPLTALNAQQWQEWKSGIVQAEVWKQWRLKHDEGERKVHINPTPSTTQCVYESRDGAQVRIGLVFEYLSNHWAEDTNGDGISTFSASTDVLRLPEDVVEAELKWRWLRSLSRPYADEKFEAEQLCEQTLAQDGTPSKLTAHGRRDLNFPNVPETGVGLS